MAGNEALKESSSAHKPHKNRLKGVYAISSGLPHVVHAGVKDLKAKAACASESSPKIAKGELYSCINDSAG